jgi:hypothetical protein
MWTAAVYYDAPRAALFAIGGGLGFALTGVLSVTFEWIAEITYPTNESTTAGMLNVSAQLCGCVMIWIIEVLLADFSVTAAHLFLNASAFLALVIVVLVVPDDEYVRGCQ